MKHLILMAALCLGQILSAQTFERDPETHLITYKGVIDVPGKTDEEIFKKTKEWFIETFRSSQDVIKGESEPNMIKGIFVADYSFGGVMFPHYHSVLIRIKSGAVQMTIDDIRDSKYGAIEQRLLKPDGTWRDKLEVMRKSKQDIMIRCSMTFQSLDRYLNEVQNDDW